VENPDVSADLSQQHLIEALGAELAPVRRLAPPWLRALGWLAVVAATAAVLLVHHGAGPMLQRWALAPDVAWSNLAAVVTAICAAWAACELAVPGRSRAWVWLPVPSALVWAGASGWGCLRGVLDPAAVIAGGPPAYDCITFIVGFSLPLSALLIWLLRRACPLRPVLTAILLGLASAAGAATLMAIFHPIDAAATDLLAHALAVCFVIAANAALGNRLLSRH
jgi:hypothetical protein